MEARVMKPPEHVLVRLSALEITAKLAKVCISYVIDICISSIRYPTPCFLIYFLKNLVKCDPSCVNGGKCDETYGKCSCPPECSGDHCQNCKGIQYNIICH